MRLVNLSIPALMLGVILAINSTPAGAQSKIDDPQKYQSAYDDFEALIGEGTAPRLAQQYTTENLRVLRELQSRVGELMLENWSEKPRNHKRQERLQRMNDALNRQIEIIRAGVSDNKQIPLKSDSGPANPEIEVSTDIVDFGISETPNAALRPQGRIENDLRLLQSQLSAHLGAQRDSAEWRQEYVRLASAMTLKQYELALEASDMSNENRRGLQGVFEGFGRIRGLLAIRDDLADDEQEARRDVLALIATLTIREEQELATLELNRVRSAYSQASLEITREINRISREEIDPIVQRVIANRIQRGTEAINAMIRAQSGADAPAFAIGSPEFEVNTDDIVLEIGVRELFYESIGGDWLQRQ